MEFKQVAWNSSTALTITTLTVLVGSSSCSQLFSSSQTSIRASKSLVNSQSLNTLKGHSAWVYAIAISPDGQLLASGSYDETIKVWHLPNGKLRYTLTGHGDAVSALAISPDGKILATGSWDNRIKLWNLETGKLIRTLVGHTDDVEAIAISSNGKHLVSGSTDKTIRIWDLQTGKELRRFQNRDWVRSVTFSPLSLTSVGQNMREGLVKGGAKGDEEENVVSGDEGGLIKIWRMSDGAVLGVLQGHTQAVRSITFSPDGKTLASGSADSTIKLWQVSTQQLLQTLKGHSRAVWSVAFSPDGKTLASGSYDKTIKLWQIPTGKFLGNFRGHNKGVWSVVFSPIPPTPRETNSEASSVSPLFKGGKGGIIASGSADETIKLWSAEN